MADFAGTVSLVAALPPTARHEGSLQFSIAVTAYTGGNLNLSTLFAGDPRTFGIEPDQIRNVLVAVGATAAYMVNWTPSASNTNWTNLGTLQLFTATGAEASGTITATVTGTVLLKKRHI